MNEPFRVCFVCTGNICRSPMAEAVFRAHVEEAGLGGLVEVDSAGTGGWHEGDAADPRTVSVLRAHGYESGHAARQFRADWFARLDLVIALDAGHERALRLLAPSPGAAAKVRLLRGYDPGAVGRDVPAVPDRAVPDLDVPGRGIPDLDVPDLDVPDPYYGGMDGFEACLDMIEAASPGLLDTVRAALTERGAA